MNVLHLLWIVPLSVSIGLLICAFIMGAVATEREEACYYKGLREGAADADGMTLRKYYVVNYNDLTAFFNAVGKVLYEIEDGGQLRCIFLENKEDIIPYFNYTVVESEMSADKTFRRITLVK